MIFYLAILPLFVAENFNFETPYKLYSIRLQILCLVFLWWRVKVMETLLVVLC